jgi:hypothetical protein
MNPKTRKAFRQECLKDLVHRLEVPTNLRLPYLSQKKEDLAKVYRQIDFNKKKLVVFDLNRTLSADSLFHEAYLVRFIERLASKIGDPGEVEKFLTGLGMLGGDSCLYKRGNVLLQNGNLILGNGEVVDVDGQRVEHPGTHIKMHTLMDLPVQIRGLAMRRGLSMGEVFFIASSSLKDTNVCPILSGFNDRLGGFLERNMFRKKYAIVTDNSEDVAISILSLMKMERYFLRDLISGAEKSINLPLILVELMDKHKVGEHEVLMVGDSWGSDIEPLSLLGIDGVHIAPPWTSYPIGGTPSVRASSLNAAIDVLEAGYRK